MTEMEAIVLEFVEEGREKADNIERHLIQLEKHPGSKEILDAIFRDVHSLKGATGFLGFTKLCALAHTGETLLTRLRAGLLVTNHEIISALLALVDAIRETLSVIQSTGKEGEQDYAALIATLIRLGKAA